MLDFVAHALAVPLARLWLATSQQSWRRLPRPVDSPLVHAAGSDSDRVLLVGSGIAVGYGVMSHELGFGGHLARELSALTGRGASVDIVARPDVSAASARAILAQHDLDRFDAVVLTLGGFEVLTLLPERRWIRQLTELLAVLDELAPARLQAFFVETAVPLLTSLPLFYRDLVAQHAELLNGQTRRLAAGRANTWFVDFVPEQGDLATLTGRSTYQDWARTIAPALARALESDVARTRSPEQVDEELRQLAVDALEIDSIPTEEIDDIVSTTRRLFGASGASVSIIDHGMQRVKAADGMSRASIPSGSAICTMAIARAEVFVIEDVTTDRRVIGTPWSTGEEYRFYAAYPIESPDGQRIGALCLVDRNPRGFSDTDAALLRDLALRVQPLLWVNRTDR